MWCKIISCYTTLFYQQAFLDTENLNLNSIKKTMPYSWFDPLSEPSNLTHTLNIFHSHEELTSATRRTRSLAADGACLDVTSGVTWEAWTVMSSPRASEGTAKSLEKLYASILSRIGVFTKANSGYININCIGLCAINRFIHWWCGLWKSPEINILH